VQTSDKESKIKATNGAHEKTFQDGPLYLKIMISRIMISRKKYAWKHKAPTQRKWNVSITKIITGVQNMHYGPYTSQKNASLRKKGRTRKDSQQPMEIGKCAYGTSGRW